MSCGQMSGQQGCGRSCRSPGSAPHTPHPEPEAASQQLNSHGSLLVGRWEQGLRVPAWSEQPASLPLISRQQKPRVAAHGGPTHRACTRGPCPTPSGRPRPSEGLPRVLTPLGILSPKAETSSSMR